MIELIEILGYAFIALVLFAIGYVFVKLFASGLSALAKHDD
jgi:hypothetical protein